MSTTRLGKLKLSSRWVSFAMLVALHLALLLGSQSTLMRPLLLMHLGHVSVMAAALAR